MPPKAAFPGWVLGDDNDNDDVGGGGGHGDGDGDRDRDGDGDDDTTTMTTTPDPEIRSKWVPGPLRGPSDAVFHPGSIPGGPGARKRPPGAENYEKPKATGTKTNRLKQWHCFRRSL